MAGLAQTMSNGNFKPMGFLQMLSNRDKEKGNTQSTPPTIGAIPAILSDMNRKPRSASGTIAGGDASGYTK